MNQIAFFISGYCIHWDSIVIALSAAGAVCIFLSLFLDKTADYVAAFTITPVAIILSLFFSRILYIYGYGEIKDINFSLVWPGLAGYCFWSLMLGVHPAVSIFIAPPLTGSIPAGGYVLLGSFIGCVLAVVLTRYVCIHNQTAVAFDCMSIAGCAGIAAGRLSSFFGISNRGKVIDSSFFSFWIQQVKNPVTGIVEDRLATFLLQSVFAGILFVFLLLFERKCKFRKNGDTAMLFCLFYCSSQFVLDSTRYDSMKMHSNGFISVVQIASMLTLILVVILVMTRLIGLRRLKLPFVVMCGMILALLGCAGFMEYYVQRYSTHAGFAYGIMSLSMCGVVSLTIMAYIYTRKWKGIHY